MLSDDYRRREHKYEILSTTNFSLSYNILAGMVKFEIKVLERGTRLLQHRIFYPFLSFLEFCTAPTPNI
jgi:hypothetical protein